MKTYFKEQEECFYMDILDFEHLYQELYNENSDVRLYLAADSWK